MSQSIQSGVTTVTGSVTATAPANVALLKGTASAVFNTTTTLATITAGKTGHIVGWTLNAYAETSPGGTTQYSINANGVAMDRLTTANTGALSPHNVVSNVVLPAGHSIDVAAGQTITATAGANGRCNAAVWYYETTN